MKKKIWMTFGPVLVAGLVFLFILLGPSAIFGGVSERAVEKGATSMSENVVQGEVIQSKAMTDKSKNYVPIFGSSELSRLDQFHPNVFFDKYKANFTPFLVGRPGTQSLSHFLDIHALGKALKNKKAVCVLSPQWFQPKGVDKKHFAANFSPLHAYSFALSKEKNTPERRYAARRLLSYRVVQNDATLKKLLENIATRGVKLPHNPFLTELSGNFQYKFLTRKDELESKIIHKSKEAHIEHKKKLLPEEKPNLKELDKMAFETGKKETGDNPFNIKQKYYEKKIKPIEKELQNSRKNVSYANSPEYDDLQLVMDAFKKVGADVLFINPPINDEWLKFTGMDPSGLNTYYQKTEEMVKRNGFKYYSLQKYQKEPYFLEDPIHLSWRGWVYIDQAIEKFMKEKPPGGYPLTPPDFYLNKAPIKKTLKDDLKKKN